MAAHVPWDRHSPGWCFSWLHRSTPSITLAPTSKKGLADAGKPPDDCTRRTGLSGRFGISFRHLEFWTEPLRADRLYGGRCGNLCPYSHLGTSAGFNLGASFSPADADLDRPYLLFDLYLARASGKTNKNRKSARTWFFTLGRGSDASGCHPFAGCCFILRNRTDFPKTTKPLQTARTGWITFHNFAESNHVTECATI